MYSRWLRNSFIYLLILVAVIAIVFSFFQPGGGSPTKELGTVIQDAKTGQIKQDEWSKILTSYKSGDRTAVAHTTMKPVSDGSAKPFCPNCQRQQY